MHAHSRPAHRLSVTVAVIAPALLLAACTAARPTPSGIPPEPGAAAPADAARDGLAALAAAARDRHLTARYALTGPDSPAGEVVVTRASDGSWRVDVPGGASVAATTDGLFRCGPSPAGAPDPAGSPDPSGAPDPIGVPDQAGCVRVGDRDAVLPGRLDPRVQHPFTDWLTVLTDRLAPLSVSVAAPPPGATGSCYAVETTSASVRPPLDPGIYCFLPDGTPTWARGAFGTLALTGPPGPAPATATLAAPVASTEPPAADPTPTS
ncbi:hypothetical protein ACFY3U_16080 [Micromonospora sp. NPDC000089]|uniref:hypothetical protein n=1 Tax=unclassified Micromonospora TaxID=2617518 RepID=UPI0036B5B48A